ncbi:MAG: hypothetical protein M1827_001146 [Pycnora praestabilis]|nr:MAG: hypothetical protein M1827_001146 [Pycnora praestabilis]
MSSKSSSQGADVEEDDQAETPNLRIEKKTVTTSPSMKMTPLKSSASTGDEAGPPDPDSIAGLTSAVLDDCLQNILFDIVLKAHREEKIMRMQSAVVVAEQAAAAQDPSVSGVTSDSSLVPAAVGSAPTGIEVTTPGATYKDGKAYLIGNPLVTTKEIFCTRCKLPRLLYPTTGKGSRPPEPDKAYCSKHPFIDKLGCDIYGNPFQSEAVSAARAKKEAKTQALKDSAAGASPSIILGPKGADQASGTAYPNVKCMNCNRSLMVTRFAQHLEKCLGIAGRQSSRNAMAKISSQNGHGSTPKGSRMGTPMPGPAKESPGKRGRDEDEEESDEEETPKKKRKLIRKPAVKATPKASEGLPKKTSKPVSQESELAKSSTQDSVNSSPLKRDRETDGDELMETPTRKKLKQLNETTAKMNKAKDVSLKPRESAGVEKKSQMSGIGEIIKLKKDGKDGEKVRAVTPQSTTKKEDDGSTKKRKLESATKPRPMSEQVDAYEKKKKLKKQYHNECLAQGTGV